MAPQVKNETMSWIVKIGGFMVSIAVMVSSYFLNSTMNKMNEMDNRISSLELAGATVSGNRFTSTDWATAKSVMDADRNAVERRLIKLEETSSTIKDSLLEIKSILKETR